MSVEPFFVKFVMSIFIILVIVDLNSLGLRFTALFNKWAKLKREKRGSRGKRLRRETTLESNFRVNLIWVGWVNFNLGGFFFFFLFGLG
jgi:hypothetical protein